MSTQTTKQSPKQHAQQAAKQILSEPFEILKSAGRQISGDRPQAEQERQPASTTQMGEQSTSKLQQEAVNKRQQETRRFQAFKQELQDIQVQEMLKKRDEERAREREKELLKNQQKQQENQSILEPVAKIKRGVLGGVGKMMGVRRKQRSTELAKTPSN